eukprot:8128148-Ditylum_brightwellii.AAC.1
MNDAKAEGKHGMTPPSSSSSVGQPWDEFSHACKLLQILVSKDSLSINPNEKNENGGYIEKDDKTAVGILKPVCPSPFLDELLEHCNFLHQNNHRDVEKEDSKQQQQ